MSDGFSIEADFTAQDLENWIQDDLNEWFDELAAELLRVGRGLVDEARAKTKSEGGFGNITWNLRSSIGCAVVRNHTIRAEEIYFPQIAKGDEGHKTGIAYAREIALLIDDGDIYLLFVAGMDYASFVQAREGTDVIEHVVGDNLPAALKGIMK
jgi:hypothetical protein